MSFPSTLTAAIDGVTEIVSAHLNNLEEKVGVDNSAIASSLDYKLRNASSVDPGHKHTAGAFSGGVIGDVFFKDPADSLWKPVGPDSANLVTKTGAQVIAGVKTFSSIPVLPASDPTTDHEATRKAYVNAQDALKVAKAGDTMSGPLAMGSQNITGVGTLAAATAQLTNPLAVIYGGTGQSSYAVGDLLYASASDALSKLADVAVGQVLVSGGIGAAPAWSDAPALTASLTAPIIYGSAASGGDLTLHSTSHGTKGKIYLGSNSVYDQVSSNLGVGVTGFGTSAAKVLGIGSGTAPSTAPADMGQLWVQDVNAAAGYAGLHKRTETTDAIEVVPGVIITAGADSPPNPYEGLMEINTYTNKINMYADAAWRQLATW